MDEVHKYLVEGGENLGISNACKMVYIFEFRHVQTIYIILKFDSIWKGLDIYGFGLGKHLGAADLEFCVSVFHLLTS